MASDETRKAMEESASYWGDFHTLQEAQEKILVGTPWGWKESHKCIFQGILPELDWHVLEIGCGVGRLLLPIAGLCEKVYGLDVSQNMIDHATLYLRNVEKKELKVGDGIHVPWEDNLFDMVFSHITLQHVGDKEDVLAILREAYRVTKPGGINRHQFVWTKKDCASVKGKLALDGYKWKIKELEKALVEVGFEMVEAHIMGHPTWIWVTMRKP